MATSDAQGDVHGSMVYTTTSGIHFAIKARLTAGDQERITYDLMGSVQQRPAGNGQLAAGDEVVLLARKAIFRAMFRRCWDATGTYVTDADEALGALRAVDYDEIVDVMEGYYGGEKGDAPLVTRPRSAKEAPRPVVKAIIDRWSALEL